MQKRIFTLALVVIIGILAGVTIVKQQTRQSLLRELLQRQTLMLQAQDRLEQKITKTGKGGGAAGLQDAALSQRISNMERRLAALEREWNSLKDDGLKAGAADVRQAPPQEDLSKVYEIPGAHSPIRGDKNAPVTIVEFVDFECPFCARFHQPVVDVLKAYPKEVNYILKNFPLGFHRQARPAAKAAFAAGEQGKYWEMADALLENARSLSEEKFKEIAGTLGLNVDKFMNDYKNKDAQWEQYIQRDMDLAQKVDVRGTPTFFLNGRKTRARDFNSFKAEIDQILSGKK